MVLLVLVVASLWLLIRLWPVLLVLVAALFVAGTLSPAVRWLEEKRVRRGFGIAIVFTVFSILVLLVVVLTIPALMSQAETLLKNEPALRAPLATWLRGLKVDMLTGALGAMAFDFSLRVFIVVAYEEFESRVLVPRIYGRALRLPSSVVLFALLAGGTLMGILGAPLALTVAATVMMLINELRVELPGEQEQPVDTLVREADDRGEEEYERRTEGVGAEQAAAIAAEISRDRREEERRPPEGYRVDKPEGSSS